MHAAPHPGCPGRGWLARVAIGLPAPHPCARRPLPAAAGHPVESEPRRAPGAPAPRAPRSAPRTRGGTLSLQAGDSRAPIALPTPACPGPATHAHDTLWPAPRCEGSCHPARAGPRAEQRPARPQYPPVLVSPAPVPHACCRIVPRYRHGSGVSCRPAGHVRPPGACSVRIGSYPAPVRRSLWQRYLFRSRCPFVRLARRFGGPCEAAP